MEKTGLASMEAAASGTNAATAGDVADFAKLERATGTLSVAGWRISLRMDTGVEVGCNRFLRTGVTARGAAAGEEVEPSP